MRARATVAICLAAVGLCAAPAGADERGTLKLRFTTDRPSAASGLLLHVTYPAAKGMSKPSPIEDLRVEAPAGTRIDPGAVPVCSATDEEFRLSGLQACPRESRIGHGRVVADTGLPFGPTTLDTVAVAGPSQIVELVMVPGTELVLALDRLHVAGATLTAHPPATPGGPPDFRTGIREVELMVHAVAEGRPAVVTTPPSCTDGRWVSSGRFVFADGVVSSAGDAAMCAVTPKAAKKRRVARRKSRSRPGRRAARSGHR